MLLLLLLLLIIIIVIVMMMMMVYYNFKITKFSVFSCNFKIKINHHHDRHYYYYYCDWVCTAVMSNDIMKDLRG